MNIVFVSHSPFHPSMVVGSHQLARVYARDGHRVLHLSLPFSIAHLTRLHRPNMFPRMQTSMRGPRQREANLYEWVPLSVIPWDLAKLAWTKTGVNLSVPLATRIRSTLSRLQMESIDIALIDEPRMVGIEQILRASKTIYRATDLYAKFRGDPRIVDAERALIKNVDGIFATSEPVAAHLRAISGDRRVDVFRNGYDADHFAAQRSPDPSLDSIGRPRVVYVGAIDHRFDITAVVGLARRLPNLQVMLYGPESIAFPSDAPANLCRMGPLQYDRLPAVLQHCDAAMLPLVDIAENHGRSPMKFYEYRAAGVPIAAYAANSLQPLSVCPSLFLYNRDRASALADAVEAALAYRRSGASMALTDAEREMSWQSIGQRMLSKIQTMNSPASSSPLLQADPATV